MTIKINNQDYKIKQTIRALFLWEEITGRQFELKNTQDNYLYFYCILLANNNDFMTWDEFIEQMDSDPNIINEITKFITKQSEIDKLLTTDETDEEGKKKE